MSREGTTVSIGIVPLGSSNELRRVVNSFINQSYQNIEVLIADDGSRTSEIEQLITSASTENTLVKIGRISTPGNLPQMYAGVLENASGQFFMWADDNLAAPSEYLSKCVQVLKDDPTIELVSPRGEAFWEGRYWFMYRDYTTAGASCFLRLGDLIRLTYLQPDSLDHHLYGLFRRKTLLDSLWSRNGFFAGGLFSLLFRVARKGCFSLEQSAKIQTIHARNRSPGLSATPDINRPTRYRLLGSRLSKLAPPTLNIMKTVCASHNLSIIDKLRLLLYCLKNASTALVKGSYLRIQRF